MLNVMENENELINSSTVTIVSVGQVLEQMERVEEYVALKMDDEAKAAIETIINSNINFEKKDECLIAVKLQYMYLDNSDVYVTDIFDHLKKCELNTFTLESLFFNDLICITSFMRRKMYAEAIQLLDCMINQINSAQDIMFNKEGFLIACNYKRNMIKEILNELRKKEII